MIFSQYCKIIRLSPGRKCWNEMKKRRMQIVRSPYVDLVFAVFVYCFLFVKSLESTIMSKTVEGGVYDAHQMIVGENKGNDGVDRPKWHEAA